MPPLIRFVIQNFLTGAAIGIAVAFGFVLSMDDGAQWAADRPLAMALAGWGFASTFGIGYLGTALASLSRE